jgi:hypothetical protein
MPTVGQPQLVAHHRPPPLLRRTVDRWRAPMQAPTILAALYGDGHLHIYMDISMLHVHGTIIHNQ